MQKDYHEVLCNTFNKVFAGYIFGINRENIEAAKEFEKLTSYWRTDAEYLEIISKYESSRTWRRDESSDEANVQEKAEELLSVLKKNCDTTSEIHSVGLEPLGFVISVLVDQPKPDVEKVIQIISELGNGCPQELFAALDQYLPSKVYVEKVLEIFENLDRENSGDLIKNLDQCLSSRPDIEKVFEIFSKLARESPGDLICELAEYLSPRDIIDYVVLAKPPKKNESFVCFWNAIDAYKE